MLFLLKIILASSLLSAPAPAPAPAPADIRVIDPERYKVILEAPATPELLQEAAALLDHLTVYPGLHVPNGYIIQIPLKAHTPIMTPSGTITFKEMTIIRTKRTEEYVICVFDQKNRPHLYVSDSPHMARIVNTLNLEKVLSYD